MTLVESASAASWNAGDRVGVQVAVQGLPAGTALAGYDLQVTFDAGSLSFNDVTYGTQLDVLGLGSIRSVTAGNASVEILESSLDDPYDLLSLQQPGGFALFTLDFIATAAGASGFLVDALSLSDQDGFAIRLTPASAVPEPASVALVLGAALAFGQRRRRQEELGRSA